MKKKPNSQGSLKTVFKLLGLFKGHTKALVIGVFLLVTTAIFTLLPPLLIKQAVDNIKSSANSNTLFYTFLLIIGSTIVKGFFYYGQRILMESTGQKIVHNLRSQTLAHINRLSFSYFDKTETGDLVSRATSDIDTLARFYSFGLVNIINNIFTFIGILAVLLYWQPLLSLAFIALLPFVFHAMKKYAMDVRPVMAQIRKGFGGLTTSVQQTFSGIETIKILGTEEFESKKFNNSSHKLLNRNLKAGKIASTWFPYVHFLMALGTAFTLLWGGYLTITDVITKGMLFGFLTYLGMLLRPIRQTGMLMGMTMTSAAAAERVFEILEQKEEDLNKGIWPAELRGSIDFKNVSFTYDKSKQVLNNVNLAIKPKETVAFVGPSGAGKSTIAALIPGFYAPNKGKVIIDNIPLNELNLSKLRQSIGYMHQQPFMFDGTIYDNLTFGKPNSSMYEVKEAAKKAMLHEFIETLPKKYHTEIGEKGVLLSGGQKQRLAMARVLITDPKILILDEPTSNLDKETEENLNKALVEVLRDRTVIIIAHRLWTIQNADTIAFIKNGSVLTSGNHQQLLASSEEYKEFLDSQLNKDGSDS